jgi:hypothetical protein
VLVGIVRANSVALSEQNSKYLERPSNRSDRPGKMQENQWPRDPVLTLWQSKRICSDNALKALDPERPIREADIEGMIAEQAY